jgi:hypothetical protein
MFVRVPNISSDLSKIPRLPEYTAAYSGVAKAIEAVLSTTVAPVAWLSLIGSVMGNTSI